MRISFLAPRLPPRTCGVGDHTRCLAEAMRQQGVRVGFVHRSGQVEYDVPPGPVAFWDGGNESLVRCVGEQEPDWLWVQLSGYGYSRWGAPYRLACGLRWMRRQLPRVRIAV